MNEKFAACRTARDQAVRTIRQIMSDMSDAELLAFVGNAPLRETFPAAPPAKKSQTRQKAPAKAKVAKAKTNGNGHRAPREATNAIDDRVERVLQQLQGTAISGLVDGTGLPRETVLRSLQRLKKDARAFMAGDRRWARWGVSPAAAARAVSADKGEDQIDAPN